MAGEDKHSKKHPASDAKKRQLKKKGQVAKSQDVPMALGLAAAFITLLAMNKFYAKTFAGMIHTFYEFLPDIGTSGQIDAKHLLMMVSVDIAILSLPVLVAVMVMGVISNMGQTGIIIASEPLIPKLNKLNPMTKIKQWFSVRSLQDLAKSMVKILAAGWIGWIVWSGSMDAISNSVGLDAAALLSLGASIIKKLFIDIIILYVIIAIIDFGFQRRNFLNQHKMTDKEVKDEYKQQEGDPYMKGKRRQMAQQIAMQGAQEHVPQGDVVVINPTELAICLKYDPDISPVPYVIAMGEKRQADDIREAAGKHGIPVVRNKPLARALYELCEIGDIVPADLFKPVAEVLAYVFSLKGQADDAPAQAAAATQAVTPGATSATTATASAAAHASNARQSAPLAQAAPLTVHELGSIPVPVLQPATGSHEAAGSLATSATGNDAGSPFTWSDQPPAW